MSGLAAYNGPVIDVFDLQTGELLYTADAHDRPIHCISVVSTATTQLPVFASCCHGGTIKLIELQTGKILEKVRCAVSGPCYGDDASLSLFLFVLFIVFMEQVFVYAMPRHPF